MILDENVMPLMNEVEISHFVKYINADTEILEVGGGSSTIFLSKSVKRIVTVEHDRKWANEINNILQKMGKDNWSLQIVEPNFPQTHTFQPAQPGQFDNYINHIKSIDDTFDVVLIDGRDRVRSAEAAVEKLKSGGHMIVHDFWNRPKYHSILRIPELRLISESNSFPTGNIVDTIVVLQKI